MNPGVVTDGLVFYYDMANIAKSYKGEPTTNQFAIPTPDSNGYVSFSVNGTGTFRRIYSGTYGGYTIQPTDIVYRYDLGTNGCHYHGNDVTITAGQYPTFTFDYYLSPDVTSFNDTFMANFENLGSGVGGSAALPNYYKGIWQTIQINGNQANATSGLRMLLYPGGCSGGRLAATGYILMKNPQVTFYSTSGKVLPFVAGTRSNTQAIVDLTGQNVITATSLTYASDGTFSFNPANSNYIDSNPAAGLTGTGSWTMESWFKINGAPSNLSYGNVIVDTDATGGSANMIVVDYGGLHGGSQNQLLYATRPSTGGSYTNLLGPVLTQGTYYHVAVVRNSTTDTKLYVNGILNNTYSGNMPTATQPLVRVGRWTDGTVYSNTTIPVVKIYNRNLSDSEVLQNFYAQRGLYGV